MNVLVLGLAAMSAFHLAIFGSFVGFAICLPTHGVDAAVFAVQLPRTMVPFGTVVLPWLYGPILCKGSVCPVASYASRR